ncbi:MAG: hypothetical protein ACOC2C_08995, partial [Cyclonatronaceae bacterium]
MRLSTRFLLLLVFVFTGVTLTVWFGVRPAYEEAVINERIVIASEHQREKLERVERVTELWAAATDQMKEDLLTSGNIERAELLFSGFSSVFSELQLLRVIEVDSGEFIEVRAQSASQELPESVDEELSVRSMLEHYAANPARPMWLPEEKKLFFISQFQLNEQQYLIMSMFGTESLHELLLSHNLGIEVQSVVWDNNTTKAEAFLHNGSQPSYRPESEPVSRAERRDVDGRPTLVISFPISV